MHKCREAPAPETPVDIGRQENYEANDDTVYEAGEDIDLLKTEKDLSDSVQEIDLSRLAWLILHSFQSCVFDLSIKHRGWASEIRSFSIYLSTIRPGLTAGVDMKEAWREIQENQ